MNSKCIIIDDTIYNVKPCSFVFLVAISPCVEIILPSYGNDGDMIIILNNVNGLKITSDINITPVYKSTITFMFSSMDNKWIVITQSGLTSYFQVFPEYQNLIFTNNSLASGNFSITIPNLSILPDSFLFVINGVASGIRYGRSSIVQYNVQTTNRILLPISIDVNSNITSGLICNISSINNNQITGNIVYIGSNMSSAGISIYI